MERNSGKNGLINLLALLAIGAAGITVTRYANSLAGLPASFLIGIGFLVALVSWFQMRLEVTEQAEKLELEEMARSKAGSTLFEAREAEVFPARRARQQFERYFVPVFAVLVFVLEVLAAWFLWQKVLKNPGVIVPERAMMGVSLFAMFALVLFILGRFSATIARLENHRYLRPSASYLLLGAYLCFITALAIAGNKAEFPMADLYVARVLCLLIALLAVEGLIALVFEIYRPRVKGKVDRPIYDSRVVGLLGQPESLFTTAAHTLDYQFGFKVSETWFFQFFQKNLPILIWLQLGVLVLSTCVVFVDPGQKALLERFGRPVEGSAVLDPGAHLKLPWPIDRTYRYATEQIQRVDVGFAQDTNAAKTILWTVEHNKEENFLVANREQITVGGDSSDSSQKAPPVSLLTVSIPVQFQIRNLLDWAYKNQDAAGMLQNIADREVVRFLAGEDFGDVMSTGRLAAADTLRERIQAAADAHNLGAQILFVGLQDIHPPVKVAPEFEKVISAMHQEQSILAAQADAIRTNALAGAQVFAITNQAEASSLRIETAAFARAAAFTNQIPAFNAAPSVYKQRAYFQTFARATANTPKFVLVATNTDDSLVFDLQNKLGQDLMNLSLAPPPGK